MSMTHYMELLAVNQPWNLLIFMAVPVILAETVAISELYLLLTRHYGGGIARLNKIAGILCGLYFAGVIAYLVPTVVVPLTQTGAWRSWIDVVAVGGYLLGGLSMLALALHDLRVLDRTARPEQRLRRHAFYVGCFLVLAHVAMIAGMLDPALFGYQAPMTMDMPMNH